MKINIEAGIIIIMTGKIKNKFNGWGVLLLL